jgi:hypothetical protein
MIVFFKDYAQFVNEMQRNGIEVTHTIKHNIVNFVVRDMNTEKEYTEPVPLGNMSKLELLEKQFMDRFMQKCVNPLSVCNKIIKPFINESGKN